MLAPLTTKAFTVALADVERGPVARSWEIVPEWLAAALAGTEATPTDKPGRLRLNLTRTGARVVVSGTCTAPVCVPCARTLEPVEVLTESEVLLVLRRAPKQPTDTRPRSERGRTKSARLASASTEEPCAEELTDELAGEDTFEGDEIVLDPFVREHILLELPAFPVRSDLPSDSTPGIGPRSAGPDATPRTQRIDPRLAPLAKLAARMNEDKE